MGLGPNLACIYRLLDPRRNAEDDDWGPRERAGLRSATANRQWPQARLCSAGLAESPECQLCVKARGLLHTPVVDNVPGAHPAGAAVVATADSIPRGTLVHRVWECAVTERHRQRLVSPLLMRAYQRARTTGTAEVAVWSRGLTPAQQPVRLADEHSDSLRWAVRPVDGWLSGKVYTDGSMIDGSPYLDGSCRRLGWSIVALDQDGNVTASAYGTPAAWIDTVYGAELWAFWQRDWHCQALHFALTAFLFSKFSKQGNGRLAAAIANSRALGMASSPRSTTRTPPQSTSRGCNCL